MKIGAICIWLGVLLACSPPVEIEENSDFIGTWNLEEWSSTLSDGQIIYPYGENAYGRITYNPNGEMMCILMADDRALMSTIDIDTRIASEALEAFNSFFAFSGPYAVNRDSSFVTHTIEGCINPNWVGVNQKRYFKFDDGKLTLSTPPIKVLNSESQETQQVLVWSKVN